MIIGKVVSVDFDQFRVSINSEIQGNSVNLAGTVYYFGNIGSYLKVKNSLGESLICEVASIFVNDSDDDKRARSFQFGGKRQLLLKPIGTISKDGKFSLGVGIFPGLYSDIEIVTYEDMPVILNVSEDNMQDGVHRKFRFGVSRNLINYPIEVGIDAFFNIHSAILGNSGSGKSNTIAHIMQQIYRKKEFSALGARILIFDVNGEYSDAFSGDGSSNVNVKLFKPNAARGDVAEDFILPYYLMTLDEWSAFLMATDATQRPFWSTVLQDAYRFYKILTEDDKEPFVNYFRNKICSIIDSILNQAETDTARVTAAGGLLSGLRNVIDSDGQVSDVYRDSGLYQEIRTLEAACSIQYGDNHNRLATAVQALSQRIDRVSLSEVMSMKLKDGSFFDHRFLRLATDMRLLEEDARGNRRLREYTSTMLARLDYFLENPDCKFMRNNPPNVSGEDEYLEYFWLSGGEEDKGKSQIVIVDVSELPPDSLETLTSVLTRVIFYQRKKLSGALRRKKPVHLILDEAHRYIKKDHEYVIRENIFERIAREGRKFSTYLLVSSQRPSELSETVLSQCANFVIHRIQNDLDMRYIYGVLPYFSEAFSAKIKQSTPGEALVFGACVSMPLHLKVDKANPEPNSKNCYIPGEWFVETSD